MNEIVKAYKGFDKNLKCRGYQFEVGGTFSMDGPIRACERGFHACEHPLNVFEYYPPATSRFCEVELSGDLSRKGDDTKIAAASIRIVAELQIPNLVQRAIEWVFDRSKPEGEAATGTRGAASATGDQGAASATGYQGAASATGYQGAASATGDQGRVMGADGCALFLVHRDGDGNITHAWAGIAGRNGVEPDVWYSLNEDGRPVKVEG